jgi:hypothetical protein
MEAHVGCPSTVDKRITPFPYDQLVAGVMYEQRVRALPSS